MSMDATMRSHEGGDPLSEMRGRLSAAEQAVLEQSRRLAVTYEHATVGIAETDAEGRRLRVNATACALTGRSREELTGGSVFDVLHPEDRDEDLRQYRRLVAGEIDRYAIEKRIVRKDGAVIWASVMSSAVRDGAGQFLYGVRISRTSPRPSVPPTRSPRASSVSPRPTRMRASPSRRWTHRAACCG